MVRFTAFVDSDDDVAVRSAEENKPAPPPRVSRFAKALEGSADEDEEDEETSDEDDEDENIPPPPAARQTRQTRQRVPTDEEDSESGSYSEESSSGSQTDEDESESDASTGPVARAHAPPQPQTRSQSRVDTTLIPWAKTVGVDAQKMHLMQASLFHQPEAERVFRDLDVEAPRRRPFRHLNRKHSRDSDGNDIPGSSQVCPYRHHDPENSAKTDIQRASFAHDLGPTPFAPSSRKYARIPNSASITTGQDGILADAGLALGRSFRVGWGPSRITAHLGRICGPSTQKWVHSVVRTTVSYMLSVV
jgi:nuclear pore complex protein Nup98-Nup96